MLPLVFLISRRPVCRTSGFTASMWAKSEGSGLGRSGAGLNTPQIRLEPAQTSPYTGQKPKPAQTRHELAQTSPRRPETQKRPKTQDRPRCPFLNGAKGNPTGQNTHHSLCVSCLQLLVDVCSPMQPISADSFVVLRTRTARGRAGAAAAAPPTQQLGCDWDQRMPGPPGIVAELSLLSMPSHNCVSLSNFGKCYVANRPAVRPATMTVRHAALCGSSCLGLPQSLEMLVNASCL